MLANKNRYCQKFQIYNGKSDAKKRLGSKVVRKLIGRMEDKNNVVFFENFFIFVQLLEDLKSKNIHACDIDNPNRKLILKVMQDKNMKQRDSQIFNKDTRTGVYKWRDKRNV